MGRLVEVRGRIGVTTISNYTAAALPAFMGDGVVAEEDIGDPAATADQAGDVSAHMTDAEKVAPHKGRQHLSPEGAKPRKSSIGDPDRVAMPAEQLEEERPPGEPAPIPQRRAPRGPKHLLAEEPRMSVRRTKENSIRREGTVMRVLS